MQRENTNNRIPNDEEIINLAKNYFSWIKSNIQQTYNTDSVGDEILDAIKNTIVVELLKLRDSYDPNVGAKFSTYSYMRMTVGVRAEAKQLVMREYERRGIFVPLELDEHGEALCEMGLAKFTMTEDNPERHLEEMDENREFNRSLRVVAKDSPLEITLALLKELHEVSVPKICKDFEISRSTFYRRMKCAKEMVRKEYAARTTDKSSDD